MKRLIATLTLTALLVAGAASAGKIEGKGEVDIITNAYPVMQHIGDAMKASAGEGLTVRTKHTDRQRYEIEVAYSSDGNSIYDAGIVASGLFAKLYAKGYLQPVTDLVEKYRDKYNIEDSMLIVINGEVYAIAFHTNLQHFFYRKDIFDRHGLKVPETYGEVIEASEILQEKEDSIDFPYTAAMATGWDVATEFTNIYMSLGGQFFKPGTAEPVFNDATGVKALKILKSLVPYMSPNALTMKTDDATTAFQQGRVAMGTIWASRARALDDEKISKVVGKVEFAMAPRAEAGAAPAASMFWDGFVFPKRMEADRDLVFRLVMEGLSEKTVETGNDLTAWLRSNFKPNRYSKGIVETVAGGAHPFPALPFFDVAHSIIGNNLTDALAGRESCQEALDDAAKQFREVAEEQGFL